MHTHGLFLATGLRLAARIAKATRTEWFLPDTLQDVFTIK
jgi:hypothetical protein